jgi:crotonobetainyl-CoA:carnitine CoA-transferase CaiB-like acyl-CoA transferase
MAGPLEGVRIIDASTMITGPLATMILADQGADVIKVEGPGFGDVMRLLTTSREGISALFANCNRSKRSVVLNLKDPEGRGLLEKLVASADVFVQNFRPGVTERLGIGEATLRALRPELVYVSISAFGRTGPYASKPAYDHVIQAVAGMAAVQRDADSGRPAFMKSALMDKTTAYTTAQAITAALLARQRTGRGQHIELSMLDAGIAFLWPDAMTNHTFLAEDTVRQAEVADFYRMLETTDGFLAVAAARDEQFHGLFRAIGHPELCEDPRFGTYQGRAENFHEMMAVLLESTPEVSSADLLQRLEAEDVPCAPVIAIDEVHAHPQVVENAILEESVHPKLGPMRQPRPPARFSDTPAEIRAPVPGLGEHTDEVLSELSLDPGRIAALRRAGVVA